MESSKLYLLFCNNYCVGGFTVFINKLYFSFTSNKITSRYDKRINLVHAVVDKIFVVLFSPLFAM